MKNYPLSILDKKANFLIEYGRFLTIKCGLLSEKHAASNWGGCFLGKGWAVYPLSILYKRSGFGWEVAFFYALKRIYSVCKQIEDLEMPLSILYKKAV